MKIELLGMSCQKCSNFMAVEQTKAESGITVEFAKVEDIKEIMKYGVMAIPAPMVAGVVKGADKDTIKVMMKIKHRKKYNGVETYFFR